MTVGLISEVDNSRGSLLPGASTVIRTSFLTGPLLLSKVFGAASIDHPSESLADGGAVIFEIQREVQNRDCKRCYPCFAALLFRDVVGGVYASGCDRYA